MKSAISFDPFNNASHHLSVSMTCGNVVRQAARAGEDQAGIRVGLAAALALDRHQQAREQVYCSLKLGRGM